MSINLNEVRENWWRGDYSCFSYFEERDLPSNYVFDENLSVKRNREMVEEHNANVRKVREEAARLKAEKERQMRNDVVESLKEDWGFSTAIARRVEDRAWDIYDDSINYFDGVADIAKFVRSVLNLGN